MLITAKTAARAFGFWVFALAALVQACSDNKHASQSKPSSFVLYSARWQNPVPVCFEANAFDYPSDMEVIKNRIVQEYKRSNVRFKGWERCLDGDPAIHIGITNAWPHTKGIGTQMRGLTNGMELAVDFSKPLRGARGTLVDFALCRENEENRVLCVEIIAVHEMGHALGLAHEQNRNDKPSWCKYGSDGVDGDTVVGEWDVDSALNYCNPRWNNFGALSDGDLAGLAYLYPKI